MADSYRPTGYDYHRRGSSPGRQRNWEGFQPGRPTPPSRSFSNMDARWPNPNTNPGMLGQRKRNASQSPDEAQARKQQKPDTQQNGVTPNNPNGARRLSTTNVTPSARPAQSGTQSPGPQRPPVSSTTIRNDAAVASSPRSPRESVTSGRSTPQQRPSNLSRGTTAPLSNGVSTPTTDSNVESQSQSLMDLLHKFSSEVASRAALEHEKNQAEARLFSAQLEYNEMEKHFRVYPAIKERKSTDMNAAREAFLAKEKLFNKHTTSQTSAVGALASLLGQLAKPADVVSRTEYDTLQKDFLELRQEMTQMKQLRTTLESINSAANEAMSRTAKISTLQQKVDLVDKENVAARTWKQYVDTKLRDVDNLVKANERRFATQKDLDDFKQTEASKFATKQQIKDLETKVEPFSPKIEALQKAQAKATQDSLNSKPLKEEVVDLQTLGAELTAKTEEAATAQEAMMHKINQLEMDIADCKEKLNVVHDSIEEEGKEVIVKRVKRLDVLVNNLSSKIGDDSNPSIRQRLNQLESNFKTMHLNIQSTKSGQPQPTANIIANSTMLDLTPLETRLSKVEKDLTALDSNQDEKDQVLISHVSDVEESLKAQFSKELTDQLSAARDDVHKAISDTIDKMTSDYEELQKRVNGLEEAIRCKADSATVATLRSDVSSISEEVRKWHAQHQRTKSASQTPAPANHAPQTNGQYQAAPQPQQLPNGVIGSPQVNGVRQPQSPYAMQHNHGHGNAQLPQHASNSPQTQKPDDLQLQINGLVAVTQQLKMRCDNLQTDEVVRSMLEQFHTIYPDSRNINSTVQSLRSTLSSVQQQLANVMQQKAPTSDQFADDVKKAAAKAEGASNTAHTVFQDLQKVWSEINTIRNAVTTLQNEVAKIPNSTQEQASNDGSIRDDVNVMRADLDKTTLVANAADRLSRGHATRLSKVVPETLQTRIAAVETRIGDLDTKVATHDQNLSKGEAALEKLQSIAVSAKKEVEKIGKDFGSLKYKVERLEEEEEADDY